MALPSVGFFELPLPHSADSEAPIDFEPSLSFDTRAVRREGRIATGRKNELLYGLIEGLPKLLAETVKEAVAESIRAAISKDKRIFEKVKPGSDSPRKPSKASSTSLSSTGRQRRSIGDLVNDRDQRMIRNIGAPSRVPARDYRNNTIVPAVSYGSDRASLQCASPRTIRRLNDLQTLYVQEVTGHLGVNDLCPRRCVSPLNFRLWGLLPWSEQARSRRFDFSWFYSWMMVLIPGVAFLASIVAYSARGTFLHPTQMFITLAAFLIALQTRKPAFQSIVGCSSALLCRYAAAKDFHLQWDTLSKFQYIPTTLLQCAIILASVSPFLNEHPGETLDYYLYAAQQASFAFCCSLVVTANSFVWHVCSALHLGVDAFGDTFEGAPDFKQAVENWGELRAVTRVVCAAVSPVFCTVTSVAIIGSLSCAITILVIGDASKMLAEGFLWEVVGTFVPVGLIAISVMRTLLKAATITEACILVPEMVNCYSFGEQLDEERSYVADFMNRSNSGFYLMGVRLTMSAVVKLLNSATLVAATLVARILAQASQSYRL